MALNPIAFTEQVVSDFLRYQLTTYPLADVNLHAQMKALLRLEDSPNTPLRRGPFISLSRPFMQGASIEQLVAEGILHPGMRSLVPFTSVRKHQENAIRAIREGKTTLVATGTGSGKTESFLYPIISRCLELAEAGAPPGIVAVLVYPMNALAEDQLERLRGLLAGRGIPFGMYVGKTPDGEPQVRGERLPKGSSNADYHARLQQIREAGESLTLIPPEERASRIAMRTPGGQPRILLTNVKQLELLLTRSKDIGLFADAPLEFLVFDEAHTFRGAQGAETACLIRRLRAFCGREADQVTCVATSATMADPERGPAAGIDFARRFFGVDATRVTLVGEIYDALRWNEQRTLPVGPPEDAAAVLARVLQAVDLPGDQVGPALSACLLELGGARLPKRHWQQALSTQLVSNTLVYHLAELLRTPRALAELPAALEKALGREVPEAEILCWLALGAACGRDDHDPLLRPVVHSFIRGVGGAVVTLSGVAGLAQLWLGGEAAVETLGDAWRRFPLLTCVTCGQHYYEAWVKDFRLVAGKNAPPEGGDRTGSGRMWEHLADALGGSRVLFVDRLVVQPDEDDESEEALDEEGNPLEKADLPAGHDFEHRRLYALWICNRCGGLHDRAAPNCASCHGGNSLVAVQVVRSKAETPGVLHSCVACAAPGRRPAGGKYREPARPVRATSVSDVHVLAQSMLHLSERPRLLVFADNRQDAAFQAGWMRDHARRFRLRALMSQAINSTGTSVGDVVQNLDAILEADRELSRALIPEVWQVAPQEDAGVKHREERLYFLRLQVLREIATGVKQRVGLEPWGRLRIEYLGLNPEHELVARWAGHLGIEPSALVEGISALLDHQRRLRMLHDKTQLFGKYWNSGNKEILYGYIPSFAAGPRGIKLSRAPSDSAGRITQWIGERPTQIWNAVATWGLKEEDLEAFLRDVWTLLVTTRILVPVKLEGWGKALPGSAGAYQIDAGKLRLVSHEGRWRCEKCRRTTVRRGPTALCLAWRCRGRLVWEKNDPDNFDLHVLDSNYEMLRVAEHSAQVPEENRERIENQFKGQGEQLNTLVCTPTLELGVDIGTLDAVLMRNVPPSAANYWQRAGRAGRRHRMAVDVTYAQATGFDQAYFREPMKLLAGIVEPPRFNLKNEVMIRKHVHATILTTLHATARSASARDDSQLQQRIEAVLGRCFPSTLRPYLFTPGGEVRKEVLDVGELGQLIHLLRPTLLSAVSLAFEQVWPPEDIVAVRPSFLAEVIDQAHTSLVEVLKRLKRRLDWARGELSRLAHEEEQKGVLDPEDQAHRKRCQRVIERLKGQAIRTRAQAQGGADDSGTMEVLAREGFLPGYGLESGSIIGSAEPPRMTHGLADFDLPRAPTLALREYVPGNAIYANGFRFVPRRFQLTPDETVRFQLDPKRQVVQELGVDIATAPLGLQEIRAVPVCNVILPSQSQISDEEDFRFQMAVAVYAMERGFHRGGTAWTWGELDLRSRRAVQLRMVNAGPRGELLKGSLGYALCLACGQSHSPFASTLSRADFDKRHLERCAHVIKPTGFFADVEVDVFAFHDVEDRVRAFSLIEALRMGAARVLEMEIEDLQIVAVGHAIEERVDVFLYDPMPGGSGLLEQLTERWEDVRRAALELVEGCIGACERSCIDCLQTFRNRFYHEHLNRHEAASILRGATGPLVMSHPIPESLPKTTTTSGQPQTYIEHRFKRLLVEAGLPAPEAQKRIDLTPGLYTVPDFFYAGEDSDEPGICIYLDGMAGHIHGNPAQAEKDRFLREHLRSRGYEVVEVKSYQLDDKNAVVGVITRIAKYLVGKEKQKALREDTRWYDRVDAPVLPRSGRVLRLIRFAEPTPESIPVWDLRVAAGAFSANQLPASDEQALIEGISMRPGLFLARIVGDSMDELAAPGSLCLWEHLSASNSSPPAPGQFLLVRCPDAQDSEYGGFTFKQLVETASGRSLRPKSTNPAHKPLLLAHEEDVQAVARFVGVVGE